MERQEKISLVRQECLQKLQFGRPEYNKIMPEKNEMKEWERTPTVGLVGGKTLLVRCVVSILLFCAFLAMKLGNYCFYGIDYNKIHSKIQENELAVEIEKQVETIQIEK